MSGYRVKKKPQTRFFMPELEQLEIRRMLAADIEPNDSLDAAVNLGVGSQLHVDPAIAPIDPEDWYRWTASSSGTLRVDTIFSHAQVDLVLSLHNANGDELVRSDTITDNERASLPITSGQVVYIRVEPFFESAFGSYQLQLTEIQPDSLEGFSGNDSIGAASDLGSSNQTISNRTIHDSDDQDFFRWTAPSDGVLMAGLQFKHAVGDLDLLVTNVSGDRLTTSQSETDDELIRLDVSAGEVVYLNVLEADHREHPNYALTIDFVSPPNISDIGFTNGFRDFPTVIPFTVSDGDTPLDQLVFTGVSANSEFLVSFGGSGSNRQLIITPQSFGQTTITVMVNDLNGGIDETQFLFNAFQPSGISPPFVQDIPIQVIAEDTSTGPISFIMSDNSTATGGLVVTVLSSDPEVIPTGNVSVVAGTPFSNVTVTPAADRVGRSLITLVVQNLNGHQTRESFLVIVTPVDDGGSNDPPTFTEIADQSINEDSGTNSIAITGVGPGGVGEGGQTVTLSASSSNPMLVTASVSGTTLNLTPQSNRFGTATITVQATDNGGGVNTYRQAFQLSVDNVNDSPTMSNIPGDRTTAGDSSRVNFLVGDLETPPSLLEVSTLSSNNTLISDSNISVSGSKINRTIEAIPTPGQFGTATITVVVSDGQSSVSDSYEIEVPQGNDPPNIGGVGSRTINEDSSTGILAFTVGDDETPANSIVVTAASSNQALIPNGNVVLGGSGENRTVNITPLPNTFGISTITLTAFDGELSRTTVFDITVNSVNDAPSFVGTTIAPILENAGAQSITGWATNISPGPANEASQTLTFSVSANSNPGLFAAGPAISPSGQMTFTPAANQVGTANISVVLTDNGGVSNGGVNTSAPQTFTIVVGSVNDPPSFNAGSDPVVNEDSGITNIAGWATAITAGPGESGQTLAFAVTANSRPGLFTTQPTVAPNGDLSFAVSPNANGSATISLVLKDNGGTTNGGNDTSATKTFAILVNPVNDAPTFTKGPNVSVAENSPAQSISNWATNITAGAPNEEGQSRTFNVTVDEASLFSAVPSIASNGTLTFTPAAGASGSANVTVTLSDDGGTANGGVDTSAPQVFSITLGSVNDPPSFDIQSVWSINEDAGPQSSASFATNITAGPNETGQNVTFQVVTNTNPGLFSSGPSITPNGTLAFALSPNAFGESDVSVVLRDDGGTANGGRDVSLAKTFKVIVLGVNDAPSFTKGANQSTTAGAGTQTIPGWATNVSAGPANEAGQALTFEVVSIDNSSLFSVAPAIAGNGTLSYTPAAGTTGLAKVGVRLVDNGGVERNGVDRSAVQEFEINVQQFNQPPSFTPGSNPTVREDSGPHAISGWASNISPGGPGETSQVLAFKATSNSNPGLFAAGPAVSAGGELTYTLTPNAFGSAVLGIQLTDNGGNANGGNSTSQIETLIINVTAVNDAPSFVGQANTTVPEDAGAVVIANWATAISAGPGESDQSLAFSVLGNSNSDLFSVQPMVSPDGTLSFTTKNEVSGSSTISVIATDNGGTVAGGVSQSSPQSFVITVEGDNDLPTITAVGDIVISVNSTSPVINFTVGDVETSADSLVVTALSSNGALLPVENVLFGGSGTNRTVQVKADSQSGSAAISLVVTDAGGATATAGFSVTIIDSVAPVVSFTERNDNNGKFDTIDSISFTFNEDVSASIESTDLVLIDSMKGTQPKLAGVSVSYANTTNTARFDLSQVVLPKGRYLATLRGNSVSDVDGNRLDGDGDGVAGDDYLEIMVNTYAGDLDLDLDVDFADFLVFSSNFGQTGKPWQSGDFDRNGTVAFADFLVLSANFGNRVAAAPSGQFITAAAAAAAFDFAGNRGDRDWWANLL